ncbi:MAG: hypothetical protein ACFFFK_09480 [Candidatus Thorarchaeota archaeon]
MYNARIKAKETGNFTPLNPLSFSLNRVIAGRAVRMIAAMAGAAVLVYLVVLVPGLIVIGLPGGVAASSKVYDEARIIQYLKYGDPIDPGQWEQVELVTEMARIRASYPYDVSKQFSK